MGHEAPLREAHPERAELPLVEHPLCLGPADPLRLGIPALREIPDALLAAAADDGDLAPCVQDPEHQPHLPLAPPAMRLAPRRRMILDLARQQRAAAFELAQHVASE